MSRSAPRPWSQRRRLSIVLGLNVALIVALVVVGFTSGSVGVLSAAGDTVADSVALVLGLLAVAIRDRHPREEVGRRAIGAAALLNALGLLVVTVLVVAESIRRLRSGATEVQGVPMLIVSVVTMLVLLLGAWILGAGAGQEDVHMRSVLLDTLADAAAAGAVAVAGAVIAVTDGFFWLDPALALVIAALVAVAAAHLVTKAVASLRGAEVDFDDD